MPAVMPRGATVVYCNRRFGMGFLIAGAILVVIGCLAQWTAGESGDPEDSPIGFVILGGISLLIGLNGLAARINVNDQGLCRRSWFGLVRRFHTWESLQSWKIDQVPADQESAGTWFVEIEFCGPAGPYWEWIKETDVDDLSRFFKFVDDIRAFAASKERLRLHGTAVIS
jgi:hypothetical protein